jgi:membrane-bound lytic murein transglycosylase B
MLKNSIFLSLFIGVLFSASAFSAEPIEFEQKREAFIRQMVEKHGLPLDSLLDTLGKAKYQQKIIDAMNRPAEGKPWKEYRPIFITRKRVEGGKRFLHAHRQILERAERVYGVPSEIIVAIIGVETFYGGYTGSFRVMDALATLGFAYPKRAKFFSKELEEFLLLVTEESLDPMATKGSYAGAMGMPQFIPSSYRSYAVDFDGDGRRDLLSNLEDVIGSVANYLSSHGWKRGGSIASPATSVSLPLPERFTGAGMKPSFTLDELAAAGIHPSSGQVKTSLSSVIELEGIDGTEYWLGFDNFYAITRYNHSNLYAMAVYQLAERIAGRAAD